MACCSSYETESIWETRTRGVVSIHPWQLNTRKSMPELTLTPATTKTHNTPPPPHHTPTHPYPQAVREEPETPDLQCTVQVNVPDTPLSHAHPHFFCVSFSISPPPPTSLRPALLSLWPYALFNPSPLYKFLTSCSVSIFHYFLRL